MEGYSEKIDCIGRWGATSHDAQFFYFLQKLT